MTRFAEALGYVCGWLVGRAECAYVRWRQRRRFAREARAGIAAGLAHIEHTYGQNR